MKRESGASPEQSRCCKLHLPLSGDRFIYPLTPLPVYIIKVGRQVNRSKSEDLQNVKSSTVAFEERAAVRMRYLFINMFF